MTVRRYQPPEEYRLRVGDPRQLGPYLAGWFDAVVYHFPRKRARGLRVLDERTPTTPKRDSMAAKKAKKKATAPKVTKATPGKKGARKKAAKKTA